MITTTFQEWGKTPHAVLCNVGLLPPNPIPLMNHAVQVDVCCSTLAMDGASLVVVQVNMDIQQGEFSVEEEEGAPSGCGAMKL